MGKFFLSTILIFLGIVVSIFVSDSFLAMVSYKSTVAVIIGMVGELLLAVALYYWVYLVRKIVFRKKGN